MRYVRLLLPFVAILAIAGCDEFSLIDQFYVDTNLPLSIYPAAAAVRTGASTEFAGQGGAPEYSYAVLEPGGGTIDPVTGLYTAPDIDGQFTVVVTDRAGSTIEAFVYVVRPSALAVSPTSEILMVGETATFTASGGTEPYVFGVAGSQPAGVGTVDAITGEFEALAPGTISVTVTDDDGFTVSALVFVLEEGGELALVAESNPETVQQGQVVTLFPSGGETPYTLAVLPGEFEIPQGYDGGNGFVSMVIENLEYRYFAPAESVGKVTVRVTDQSEPQQTADLTLTILPSTPAGFVANGATGNPRTIRLSWNYSKPGVDAFDIERVSGGQTDVVTVGGGLREHLDTELSPNTPYEYRVRARVGDYVSLFSEPNFAVSNP